MERSKFENTVLGMVGVIVNSIRESGGKLTVGERNSLIILKELCTQCLEISNVQSELEVLIMNITGEEAEEEKESDVLRGSGKYPWHVKA